MQKPQKGKKFNQDLQFFRTTTMTKALKIQFKIKNNNFIMQTKRPNPYQ